MTLDQVLKLAVDGAEVDLRVSAVSGRERLHAPFSFEVTCAFPEHDGAPPGGLLDLVSAPARLTFAGEGGAERVVSGLVDEVEVLHGGCRFTLVPKIAAAMDEVDHRVFVDLDAVAVARAILEEHGIGVELRLMREPAKRAQWIQAFEGDLDFVSRVLAFEGITWLPAQEGHGIVLADHPAAYPDREGGPLPFREDGGLLEGEAIRGARLEERVTAGEVALGDHDFERPTLDLTVTSTSPGGGGRRVQEFPGGYSSPAVGRALAQIRLEEARGRGRVLTGETSARGIRAGVVLTATGAAQEAMNGRWLIVEVTHEARERRGGERPCVARFTAVPEAANHRPARRPAPRLGGVATANVAGPGGAEIHTEEHARVRLQHRWDRRAPGDDRSSAWVRTVQPALSGAIFLPRTGWDVLVGFRAGAGDEPLVLGRLYTGEAPPPSGLPREKVVSAFGTRTTPGGGSENRIGTDDTAGNEGMAFTASNDWNERTENDKVTAVKGDDAWTIGASRTVTIAQVFQQAVDGAQSFQVGGSRTVHAGADIHLQAASESVTVGGLRGIKTGGDHTTVSATFSRVVGGGEAQAAIEHQSRFVKGSSTVVNGGAWVTSAGAGASQSVGGASALTVGGGKSVACSEYTMIARGVLSESYASRALAAGGDISEEFKVSATYDITGPATIQGSDVTVESSGTITIKAGGATIKMSAGKIEISGDFKGSVGSDEKGTHTYG